jgi:hypothetical protein
VSRKYIRKTDADRITNKLKAALAALGDELARAVADRVTPEMTAAEIEAVIEAEIGPMLKDVDQLKAAMDAQLDAAAIDGRGSADDDKAA